MSLGATLGLEVVAEGIERPSQMAALRLLGCKTGQGYLIGRPMDMAATRALAARAPRAGLRSSRIAA